MPLRLLTTSYCLFILLLAPCFSASAQTGSGNAGLLDFAGSRVFRIEITDPEGKVYGGSAVLIDLAEKGPDGPCTGTFVTAYHVLHRARAIRVYHARGTTLVKADAETAPAVECFPLRTRELAFIKLALPSAAERQKQMLPLEVMPLKPAVVTPPTGPKPAEKPRGMAFGFSKERAIQIDHSEVEFLGPVQASSLGLLRPIKAGDDEPGPNSMQLMLLTNQATLGGMSGGLVLGSGREFGGLVYGRDTDRYNLVVPAAIVAEGWDLARRSMWKPFSTSPFDAPGAVGLPEGEHVDRIDWGAVEGLTLLLGNDPSQALARFQEIVISPPQMGPDAPPLEVIVDRGATLPDDSHSLDLSLDGKTRTLEGGSTLRIPLKMIDGEALLIVSKGSGKVNDFELGGLVAPSVVDLAFKQGGLRFRRVIRSLPRIVQRYPLFVTIRNTSERPGGGASPANARLAIRLDYLEGLLEQAPIALGLTHGPDSQGSVFRGAFELDTSDGWELRRISGQRLGIEARGHAAIAEARYQAFGLALQRDPEAGPIKLLLRGTLQFPSDLDRFYVSARATGTVGRDALRIDLGNGFNLDVGGLLRHLFTCYVNNRLLLPDFPRSVEVERIRRLLADIGLDAPGGWTLRPRQIRLVPGSGGSNWIITTARLEANRDGPGGPDNQERAAGRDPGLKAADLISPPGGDAVFDLSAWDVPGSLLARIPSLPRANPWVAETLTPSRVERLRLTISVPASARALDRLEKPIPLQEDEGRAFAERLRSAFAHSVGQGRTALDVAAGHDLARRTLARALGIADMEAVSVGESSLSVGAEAGGPSGRVAVGLTQRPARFETRPGERLDIGSGFALTHAVLEVTDLEASGNPGREALTGKFAATVAIDELQNGDVTLKGLAAGLRAEVDTTMEPGLRAELELKSGEVWIKGKGPIKLAPATLPVSYGQGKKFEVDPKSWSKFVAKQVVGR